MKFENTDVWGFKGALRGMRNPKESWAKQDSIFIRDGADFTIGPKDMKLAQMLIKSGSTHRKFLRQIIVSVDISAPLYWWKEFDTYKVGTTANSTSTMHKLATTPITMERFEIDLPADALFCDYVEHLEYLRQQYLETHDNDIWRKLVQMLPNSWIQTRTVTLNYENLFSMARPDTRRNHKLKEWSVNFMNWARSLPYAEELIFIDDRMTAKEIVMYVASVMDYNDIVTILSGLYSHVRSKYPDSGAVEDIED